MATDEAALVQFQQAVESTLQTSHAVTLREVVAGTLSVTCCSLSSKCVRRTRLEALKIWTGGSAYQNFDDDKGLFEEGKVADMAVLSADLLQVSDARLRWMKSAMTIVGGKIVHEGDWPDYAQIGDDFFYTGT
ncbi:amidohydrolase family protein [Hyphomicrobium sp.]|uniref:amidohydrolase family protein n=1 Tax=Hyphomicrobium sp. TaxID=82 RepID=UPI001DBE73CF|nr:amidohydrolase family protein [Hyphomicrobium sp.]MBY0562370.1 amidohydrolase family protein [Hyphomicrobium sp.]